MAWNTLTSYGSGNFVTAAIMNGIGNDLRAWGGNVDAGAYQLTNCAAVILTPGSLPGTPANGMLAITAGNVLQQYYGAAWHNVGAAQTPWTANVAGGGFTLTGVSTIGVASTALNGTNINFDGSGYNGLNNVQFSFNLANATPASFQYAVMYVLNETRTAGSERGQMRFFVANAGVTAERLTILGANIGIGTASPTHLLHLVSDDAAKPTTNTWTILSDARTKRNVTDFTDGMEVLRNISPIRYEHNGLGGTPEGAQGIGVIAQDVAAHIPYCITARPGKLNADDVEDTQLLTFNSHALLFVVLNAIKGLDARMLAGGL